jgi:hypothetical protein
VSGPEFKPQYHQKEGRKEGRKRKLQKPLRSLLIKKMNLRKDFLTGGVKTMKVCSSIKLMWTCSKLSKSKF